LRRYKRKSVEAAFFEAGWVTLSANFRRNEASPANHCWCQKNRVIAFSCGTKMSAVHSLVLLQTTRMTDGRTDRRTNRITTPKTALCSRGKN